MSGQGRPKLGLAFGGGGIRGMAHIGLIEQLEFEGYTHEQAVYGVEQNGY